MFDDDHQAPPGEFQTQKYFARNIMLNTFKNFVREEEGQDLVEYALLLALITLAVAAVLPAFGDALKAVWTSVQGKLSVS